LNHGEEPCYQQITEHFFLSIREYCLNVALFVSEIDWGNLLAHVEEHLAKAPELGQYPLASMLFC
jgi:hypothetical protein